MSALPCAIYTRKSSEEGLEQGFNSLDAQREACEAFVLSQKAQGWKVLDAYDDGGFSGGNVERPGLKRLLADIALKKVRVVVVYKVDRLTRSLADFAKLVELFDAHGVSFVSVTQQLNTTSSMGRLTLNVLLSFAQFEREVTGERIRDKIAASKRKGMWMGGFVPMGYRPKERTLVIDELEAERVREISRLYLEHDGVQGLKEELDRRGWKTPVRSVQPLRGGRPFSRGYLYRMLSNAIYIGQIVHKGVKHEGLHPAIIDAILWQAVQARLADNLRSHEHRSNAAEASLLAGLIYDEAGHRLQPTHTKKTFADGLGPDRSGELVDRLRGAISRVTVSVDKLEIAIRLNAVWSDAAAEEVSDVATTIVVPAQIKRCGQAVRLIVRGPDEGRSRGPDPRLITLLARAQRWFGMLTSGQHPSVLSIAQEHGLASADVTRTIYLAFLAPDITQMILRGEQPIGLGVKKLLAMAPLAMDWADQRRILGRG